MVDFSGKLTDKQIIGPELFSATGNPLTNLLLGKTGYASYWGTDRYTMSPPGLAADLAVCFRNNYPKLRCVGMDLISISSYSNRKEGREAHLAFLNPDHGDPILLIEDMKLDSSDNYEKVIVAPILIDNADGSPCTVFAYTKS
jgi:arylformamidase